jgi:hypothetical protein
MFRKTMIALAAVTFVGALAVSSTVDARGGFGGGGHFGGGGMRMGGGGFGGGGMRFAGGGFRGAGFRGGFVGSSRFAFRPGFAGRRFIGPGRFAFRPGFRRFNRFAFAAVPFGVGLIRLRLRWVVLGLATN